MARNLLPSRIFFKKHFDMPHDRVSYYSSRYFAIFMACNVLDRQITNDYDIEHLLSFLRCVFKREDIFAMSSLLLHGAEFLEPRLGKWRDDALIFWVNKGGSNGLKK